MVIGRSLLIAVVLAASLVRASTSTAQASLCFDIPDVIHCVDERFRSYWEQNGGLPVFGYPLGRAAPRRTANGAFLTQAFERARLELHPELAPPYHVLLARIGAERLDQLGREGETPPPGEPDRACLWFHETRQSVCDQAPGVGFRTYWSGHGLQVPGLSSYQRSLALFGLPLGPAVMETNAAGHTVLAQWFERARFEYHPAEPTEFKVLLGLLGREVMESIRAPESQPFNPEAFTLELELVAEGFRGATHIAYAGDRSSRFFVVEKEGQIRVVDGGQLLPRPFLDLSDRVEWRRSEMGLFSIAFHPLYAQNGYFFVDYTDLNGDTMIERYTVSSDSNVADPASATPILAIDQPSPRHNGGQLQFGPDGYLYIGMGDGGVEDDAVGNAQNPTSLLGKMLRIDVDRGLPYTIPPDNPFANSTGTRPEIWASGLRNPWRFSFDRVSGDLFIADVGESEVEEINFQPATSRGGENYGWNIMEGTRCFSPREGCAPGGLALPIMEYSHDEGCSVTGGYRYRGRANPAFGSAYFFADFCSGRLWAMGQEVDGGWRRAELLATGLNIGSFGEDPDGELLVVDTDNGGVYRLVARPK